MCRWMPSGEESVVGEMKAGIAEGVHLTTLILSIRAFLSCCAVS